MSSAGATREFGAKLMATPIAFSTDVSAEAGRARFFSVPTRAECLRGGKKTTKNSVNMPRRKPTQDYQH